MFHSTAYMGYSCRTTVQQKTTIIRYLLAVFQYMKLQSRMQRARKVVGVESMLDFCFCSPEAHRASKPAASSSLLVILSLQYFELHSPTDDRASRTALRLASAEAQSQT
jgi:hypothetical protein